jgi:hypothetical protein
MEFSSVADSDLEEFLQEKERIEYEEKILAARKNKLEEKMREVLPIQIKNFEHEPIDLQSASMIKQADASILELTSLEDDEMLKLITSGKSEMKQGAV